MPMPMSTSIGFPFSFTFHRFVHNCALSHYVSVYKLRFKPQLVVLCACYQWLMYLLVWHFSGQRPVCERVCIDGFGKLFETFFSRWYTSTFSSVATSENMLGCSLRWKFVQHNNPTNQYPTYCIMLSILYFFFARLWDCVCCCHSCKDEHQSCGMVWYPKACWANDSRSAFSSHCTVSTSKKQQISGFVLSVLQCSWLLV